jgi:hypothetical protein
MTVQGPVPLQPPPLKPPKVKPGSDAAVKVTEVPLSKDAEQVLPQLIPAGLLVTVPLPAPALVTVRVRGILLKVAVHVLLPFIVTTPSEQSASPLKPAKKESAAGFALRVTEVPLLKEAEQVLPQVTPAGEDVTEPLPLPNLLTLKVRSLSVIVMVALLGELTV